MGYRSQSSPRAPVAGSQFGPPSLFAIYFVFVASVFKQAGMSLPKVVVLSFWRRRPEEHKEATAVVV